MNATIQITVPFDEALDELHRIFVSRFTNKRMEINALMHNIESCDRTFDIYTIDEITRTQDNLTVLFQEMEELKNQLSNILEIKKKMETITEEKKEEIDE